MDKDMHPELSIALLRRRTELTLVTAAAFKVFSNSICADGALSGKTRDLIAVAVAHFTQCLFCIRSHAASALRKGATQQELIKAIWVAAEMRAGGACAHANLALGTMSQIAATKNTRKV